MDERTKTCSECGKPFLRRNPNQHLCGADCRRAWWRRLQTNGVASVEMNTGDRGAYAELLVCADLMRHGWDVFRAVSPAAKCDLLAVREGRVARIEVRSGAKRIGGGVTWSKPPKDEGRFDHYAVVTGDEILYDPHL